MIVRFNKPGKSFKALGQYLTHDAKAETAERVAWAHTLNCANDHVASAIHEMYNTYLDAEVLKGAAGVKRGGQPLLNPVRHFSLSWHPEESPSREEMIEATEAFLKHMGWDEHQAVLTSHTDKPHPHVHCMLNAVHPESGLVLDDAHAKRRAAEWREAYDRERGRDHCPQRDLPPEQREPAPTRPAWMAFKEAEREFQAHENARRQADQDRTDAEARPKNAGEAWDALKTAQREARMEFFADGKQAYRDIRDAAFRQTRSEFRELWAEFYQLQRDGLDIHLAIEMRDDLVKRQHEALTERRDRVCAELRETRDVEYAGLLASQKAERAQLTAHLAGDDLVQDIPRPANNQNTPEAVRRSRWEDDFRTAAREVTLEASQSLALPVEDTDRAVSAPHNDQDWSPRAIGPRVRDADDLAIGLTGGVIGGLATIAEDIFDGFFGQPVTQQPKAPAPLKRAEPTEATSRNVFAEAAEEAKRRAELDGDEKKRTDDWWDERRSRARD